MKRVEDGCVGCGLPCKYDACPYYKVVHLYCDHCGCEVGELYSDDEQELCKECMIEKHKDDIVEQYGEQWLSDNTQEVGIE